jgi:alpha-D-xyloside xylohydrolase
VYSDFRSLRDQIAAGISTGMAGAPWWTSDIGGFIGGWPDKPEFRELLIRWFQFGCFCPVFRLHGERQPFKPLEEKYKDGIEQFSSGQDNEIWSYGEDNCTIMTNYIMLRERLRPYLRTLYKEASASGAPLMRALCFEFPADSRTATIGDEYLLGPSLLVAPVIEQGAKERRVYLPEGATWRDAWTGKECKPGWVKAKAPLETIPLFLRDDAELPIVE